MGQTSPDRLPVTSRLVHLRQKVCLNHFKRLLLNDLHRPNDPQTELALAKIAVLSSQEPMDPRTWAGWFGQVPRTPKRGIAAVFDDCADRLGNRGLQHPGRSFYGELLEGGLMKVLLAPTKSKTPEAALHQRASTYTPLSPLHLHLDCLEVAAHTEGTDAVSWASLVTIAASRLQEILFLDWNLASGSVYASLPSDFSLAWNAADEDEKQRLKAFASRFRPPMFERWMNTGSQPRIAAPGHYVDLGPSHSHQLLLAIAEDPRFLREERRRPWSVALANATLLLGCIAIANRYVLHSSRWSQLRTLEALEALLFGNWNRRSMIRGLADVQSGGQFHWSIGSYKALIRARCAFQEFAAQLGFAGKDVQGFIDAFIASHPVRIRQ